MKFRRLFLVLPLMLAGCAWSPFNMFSGGLKMSDSGLGGIGASTALQEDALNSTLDGRYTLRNGMQTSNGKVIDVYIALNGDNEKIIFSGPAKGDVDKIESVDVEIGSEWGVNIGAEFASIYEKAFEACHKISGDVDGNIECRAPESAKVSYVFSGNWNGPAELMPSDAVLKNWKVSKIIWRDKP